ncbi:hypothetical protein BGZ63DRAFT_46792 [Mariannaea sp. PMI_226]|nr:hypothetical protein BGZ63DRAFT_46792 [Mariannaea sp. PMI_226]
MSSPNPPSEDEGPPEATPPESPETPEISPTSAVDSKNKQNATDNVTPRPVPAAGRPRAKTAPKKPEPSLLHDFLKGRPTPARVAADRKRRMSLETVKAELRHEMKQSAVRRIQPPGGVKDRVKKWQKANAAAAAKGTPEDAATEPTEVAFQGDDYQSVTEEDRMRVKKGIKIRPAVKPVNQSKQELEAKDGMPPDAPAGPPPKKRVISDEHWRKNRPRRVSKNFKSPGPAPLPKDFTIKNSANPTVSSKVKAWAERVEVPETPPPRSHRYPRSVGSKGWTDTESEIFSETGDTASDFAPSNVTSRVTHRSAKSVSAADDGIRVKPLRPSKLDDDGIRIKPLRTPKRNDDGIRVTPIKTPGVDDDGIRVRPLSEVSSDATASRPGSIRTARLRLKSTHSSRRSSPRSERTRMTEETAKNDTKETIDVSETKANLPKSINRSSGKDEITEEEPMVDTPTKQRNVSGNKKNQRPKGQRLGLKKKEQESSPADETSEEYSNLYPLDQSDLSSSILDKSIADISGEIPFGNSAFSELDLPIRGGPPRSRPKQPKVDRNTSFKGMSVFKKVMEEGKKIIHDLNEPPRGAVPNNPPSIEKWLDNTLEINNTTDPFVETPKKEPATPTPKKISPEPEPETSPETVTTEKKPRRKPSRAQRRRSSQKLGQSETEKSPESAKQPTPKLEQKPEGNPEPKAELKVDTGMERTPETKKETGKNKTKSPHSGGLKRSRATRTISSPVKPGVKQQFLGMLKEAFQGESGNQLPTPKVYQSREERTYGDEETELTYDSRYDDSRYEDSRYDDSRYDDSRYGDSRYTNSRYDDEWTNSHDGTTEDWEDSDLSRTKTSKGSRPLSPEEKENRPLFNSQIDPRMMPGPRLRPPTNGHHELSTILSEEGSSAVGSDTISELSHSTVTQSTNFTEDNQSSKRNQVPGLKRRLTRHSDLVSVLSLPDDKHVPTAMKGIRSRPSLRKNRGGPYDVTNEDLLREFVEDENMYNRELKTLVDGVIPVLLSQVLDENNSGELFGNSLAGRTSGLSKSVVNMGVALEKLRTAHQKAPTSDLRRLASWAHGVVPIYHRYLDAWRLGFQDLVVNLAPAAGVPEDEDSLLDAMPRNEYGDIVDAHGERVDVAHLLKRPLLRVKQLAKFIKCIDSIIGTNDTYYLLRDFEQLQEKARRRHREETARLVDEDAYNTDTTRSRDLRTFAPMEYVYIETTLQVAAKDFFYLDLVHSNGQRLECQVELVHRDSEKRPEDKGDILIRETGDGDRSYLLFPPIPMDLISARTGEGNFDMVVMVRGTHDDRPWFELLTLTADNEDQILDWLDIFAVAPVPPREPEPSVYEDDEEAYRNDVPVGVRGNSVRSRRSRSRSRSPSSPYASERTRSITPTTPTLDRRRPRSTSPLTPRSARSDSPDSARTPTQDQYDDEEERNTPLRESMRPDPSMFQKSPNSTPYRDDGAPPPPVHRTLTPSPQSSPKSQSLSPPVELQSGGRVKRRNSSPLKHEYLPSEGSSISHTEGTDDFEEYTETESDIESSDDEIESVDLPETELGVSIKHDVRRPPPLVESVLSGSEYSLTPSNSASQAGLHGQKTVTEDTSSDDTPPNFAASISKWSEKGLWKDISTANCSIIVTPGLIEAYAVMPQPDGDKEQPMLALDLTPLVLIRQSTAVDLEIRSSVRSNCLLAKSHSGGNFRFRCASSSDCYNLYMSVHHARLNNQKFIQLENEARFKGFGEKQAPAANDDTSSHRRSWFGRKNSYRSSVRAPSQSYDGASTTPSSNASAKSFLKRLTGAANLPFNLARSSVDRNSRANSYGNDVYTPGSSSNGLSTPRSPSISVENSDRSSGGPGTENIRIRLHLLVSSTKWEDFGNCTLQIRRPPPGWRQALRANHGLEKRVTVTTIPRKDSEKPKVLLDAVLGSGCFTPMGSRGIVCGVWEEMKDDKGVVGAIPATGPSNGNVKKWCFQCSGVAEAGWVLRLVHQEVFTM